MFKRPYLSVQTNVILAGVLVLEDSDMFIFEHNKQAKIQREMDKQHDIEVHEFWIKVWTWTWQITIVVICFIGMWWWLSYASKGKLPFLW